MNANDRESVLFLCTGNSCRSQMAEALLRHRSGDSIRAVSAGLRPKDEVHPYAIKVLQEIGVSVEGLKPKSLTEFLGKDTFRTAIFMCASAEASCPTIYPFALNKLSWAMEDPASFAGSEEDTLAVFRRTRNLIDFKIKEWLGLRQSIVVLCTGNSARSQMTAAWMRHLAGDKLIVHSAGVKPSKTLHPMAVQVMFEEGINIPAMGEMPKHYSTWAAPEKHDYAVFVCPSAEGVCADWDTFAKEKLSWPTEDPGDHEGTPDEKLERFRVVRDIIRDKVSAWLQEKGILQ